MTNNSKELVVRRSYPWVEGRVIPVWAESAIIAQSGGPVMTVVCEMSEQKQASGWPKFNIAYLDVGLGLIICQQTAENITHHVIRYMPIDEKGIENE